MFGHNKNKRQHPLDTYVSRGCPGFVSMYRNTLRFCAKCAQPLWDHTHLDEVIDGTDRIYRRIVTEAEKNAARRTENGSDL